MYRLAQGTDTAGGHVPGTLYIPAHPLSESILKEAATELGLSSRGLNEAPAGLRVKLTAQRIALWDVYGGSMPSGWTRWLLERHHFTFDLVDPGQIDAGELKER